MVDAFKICKRSVDDGCVEGVVPKTGDIGEGEGGRMDCVSMRITAADSHTCHLTSAIQIRAKRLLTTGKRPGVAGTHLYFSLERV